MARKRPVRQIANATGTLSEKAMLIRLNIGQWTAKKQEKAVSSKAESDNFAKAGTLSTRKLLIAKEAMQSVNAIVSLARSFHQENTLPWHDNGSRILPATNYMPYMEEMRKLKSQFDSAVQQLITNYPDYILGAKKDLGSLYNEEDYPTQAMLSAKYRFIFSVDPMPQAQDFRISLQGDEVNHIQKDIENRLKVAEEAAMDDLWRRMQEVVQKLRDKMDEGKDAKFKNSIIGNIEELTELIPRLNITGDPVMDKMCKQIERTLVTVDPVDLREDDDYKADVKDDAQEILDAMAAYCG